MKQTRSLTNLAKRTDLATDEHLRIWYLYDMLYKRTDETHTLTTPEIVKFMNENYGIFVHRTTVPYDIAFLEAAGVKIGKIRKQAWHFYLAEREFTMDELRLLVSAVKAADFIPEDQTNDLIKKIIKLASEPSADNLMSDEDVETDGKE